MCSDGCRVAAIEDYDALFDGYAPNLTKYVNRDNLVHAFGCSVPMTEAEAIAAARAVSKVYKETQDGIYVLTSYRNFSFEDLKNGKASKN